MFHGDERVLYSRYCLLSRGSRLPGDTQLRYSNEYAIPRLMNPTGTAFSILNETTALRMRGPEPESPRELAPVIPLARRSVPPSFVVPRRVLLKSGVAETCVRVSRRFAVRLELSAGGRACAPSSARGWDTPQKPFHEQCRGHAHDRKRSDLLPVHHDPPSAVPT